MKIWAVYTQFEPTHKYEENLENLWSTKELAIKSAQRHKKIHDYVWVQELNVDSEFMMEEENQLETIK